jgi:hypothetical protein
MMQSLLMEGLTVVALISLFCTTTIFGVNGDDYEDAPTKLRRAGRTLQVVGQITAFRLINADTGTSIFDITANRVVNLAALPTSRLNIQAVTSGTVGSVRFGLNSNVNVRTESVAPYALCGDKNGTYAACTVLVVGTYTLTGTPFVAASGGGTAGVARQIAFTIVNTIAPTPVKAPIVQPVTVPIPVPVPVPVPIRRPTPPTAATKTCKVPQVRD